MNNFAEHPELVQLNAWRKLCRSNQVAYKQNEIRTREMKIYLREKSIFQHCLVLISISSDIPYRYNILFIFFLFFSPSSSKTNCILKVIKVNK